MIKITHNTSKSVISNKLKKTVYIRGQLLRLQRSIRKRIVIRLKNKH